MKLTRRDFLKATSAVATALGVPASGLLGLREALGTETSGLPPIVWLQAQSCTGCSVSLINTISIMPIDELLVGVLDLDFHPTVMAGAGAMAVGALSNGPAATGVPAIVGVPRRWRRQSGPANSGSRW